MSHKNRCINWNSTPINRRFNWFDIFAVRPFSRLYFTISYCAAIKITLVALCFSAIFQLSINDGNVPPLHAISIISFAYFSLFSILLLLPVPQLIRYFSESFQRILVRVLRYSRLTFFHLCYDSASLFAFSVQFIPPSFSKTVYKLF